MTPNATERARDEQILRVLNLWDADWTSGEISREVELTRCAVIGMIARVNEADPEALSRKPQRTASVRSKTPRGKRP